MNSRFSDLWQQAQTIVEHDYPEHLPEWEDRVQMIRDVFAELIVQECSRVAKLQTRDNRVCDAIEGYFGIEL